MTWFASLLGGINVGGHRNVPMGELRGLFADLGYPEAKTYIQSGNVVFEAEAEAAALEADLGGAIERRFGFPVLVIVRSREELDAVIAANPFDGRDLDLSRMVVTFLSAPIPEGVSLVVPDGYPEEVVGAGREVYVSYPDGMGRSTLDRSGVWKPLAGIGATTRNWRTVCTLRRLMGE
ncbi:DUF1697 domain-containing protein [Antribacter gilvus]|uniref:DUF1697 domain-containing protein n=1 Tax=Antribacter gilvus TaxID=2304675 RepID=UPI000F778D84|nr:DUF1697 domain-containing protein [Antribacter gilvus]